MTISVMQSLNTYQFEGDTCYRVGNFENALCWFNKALRKHPTDITILTKKANTLICLKRYTQAYKIYTKVFLQTNSWGLVDEYIHHYSTDLTGNIQQLRDLLQFNYNIPLIDSGLQSYVTIRHKKINELKRIDTWNRFRNRLQTKRFDSLDKYYELFLKEFGESFYNHFISFYCYLYEQNIIRMNIPELATILTNHRKKMKLKQFERFLKTGRKQPLLDKMTGVEFVNHLADFFERTGYFVKKNPSTHDYGADLLIRRSGKTIAIQAKCRKQPARISAVQEVHGGKDYYYAQKAVVISLGGFTKSAVNLANRLGVELWNRQRLLDEINRYRVY